MTPLGLIWMCHRNNILFTSENLTFLNCSFNLEGNRIRRELWITWLKYPQVCAESLGIDVWCLRAEWKYLLSVVALRRHKSSVERLELDFRLSLVTKLGIIAGTFGLITKSIFILCNLVNFPRVAEGYRSPSKATDKRLWMLGGWECIGYIPDSLRISVVQFTEGCHIGQL